MFQKYVLSGRPAGNAEEAEYIVGAMEMKIDFNHMSRIS